MAYEEAVLEPLHKEQARKAAEELERARQAEERRVAEATRLEQLRRRYPPGPNNYAYHQCVWYVATRVPVPASLGDARNWLYSLPMVGFHQTDAVRGAIGITQIGRYGHAIYAEMVEGQRVYISEYNGIVPFGYSERWVSSNEFAWFVR